MLEFNWENPFPLVVTETLAIENMRQHSADVDAWLGIQTETIERTLYQKRVLDVAPESSPDNGQELWLGLSVQALLTPYVEIREILNHLNPQAGECVVDLGAAYARMAFVLAAHYPNSKFIGYEIVQERIQEALRCLKIKGNSNISLVTADLKSANFNPPLAEYYFIYDFGSREAILKILEDLRELSLMKNICVVGRGRLIREAIERHQPWLVQKNEAQHFKNYTIYCSNKI